MFYGDYKPFRKKGLKDCFCISTLWKKEKEAVRKFVETPQLLVGPKLALGMKIPELLKHYHNKEDKSKYLNESAMKMTSNVLFHTIKELDKFK